MTTITTKFIQGDPHEEPIITQKLTRSLDQLIETSQNHPDDMEFATYLDKRFRLETLRFFLALARVAKSDRAGRQARISLIKRLEDILEGTEYA